MKWNDPKHTLPEEGQTVWCMLQPHKYRGDLLSSAMSIEIVCGKVLRLYEKGLAIVQNYDELGRGSISWNLIEKEFECYDDPLVIAWVDVNEMSLPNFYKE